ncbi:MAG TPA: hypothetical protein PKY82_04035 [Pyrinomonadaceae bacterium]|nr:hypothetical protein [Pyrinomonadaceae bacterium]
MSVNLREVDEMSANHEKDQQMETAQEVAPEAAETEYFSSELNQPCWSVVTYKSVAVSRLTYEEAAQWAEDLKKQGISGICVITDDAAARIAD